MDKYTPQIYGIAEFQKQGSALIKKVMGQKKESFIVSHNKPQVVIMSLKRYDELRKIEEDYLKEEDDVLQVVSRGDEEFLLGKTIKVKSMKSFL